MALTKLKKGNENYQRNQINAILDEVDTLVAGVSEDVSGNTEDIATNAGNIATNTAAIAKQGKYAAGTIAGAAPTHAELVTIFGSPATLGAGFNGWVNGGAAKCFAVMTDGTNWYYAAAATQLTPA